MNCRIPSSSATLAPAWLRRFVFQAGVTSVTRASSRSSLALRLPEAVIEQSGQRIKPLSWVRASARRSGIRLRYRNVERLPRVFSGRFAIRRRLKTPGLPRAHPRLERWPIGPRPETAVGSAEMRAGRRSQSLLKPPIPGLLSLSQPNQLGVYPEEHFLAELSDCGQQAIRYLGVSTHELGHIHPSMHQCVLSLAVAALFFPLGEH